MLRCGDVVLLHMTDHLHRALHVVPDHILHWWPGCLQFTCPALLPNSQPAGKLAPCMCTAPALAAPTGLSHITTLCAPTAAQLIDAFFPAPPLQGYARRMAADDFSAGAGFTVDLGLKDVKYMRQLAEGCACPLPLADLVHGHLLAAKADGRGGQDWSAAATAVRRAAGLAPDGAGAAAGAAAAGGGQS